MNTFTVNTESLRERDIDELRRYAKLLDTYVTTRPGHMFGLCYWLRTQEHNHNGYDFIDAVTSITKEDGERGSYLESAEGPTDLRVSFAGAIAWAIAAELKRREQPKEPRKLTINLKKASLQRIFEFGLRHIRKQGRPSFAADTRTCMMRGPEGTACVVGSMIDDKMAHQCDHGRYLSGPSTDTHEWVEVLGKGRKAETKAQLLREMQGAHDDAACDYTDDLEGFRAYFETRMREVAENFTLTYKPVGVTLRA
jgi:hypothetical protein